MLQFVKTVIIQLEPKLEQQPSPVNSGPLAKGQLKYLRTSQVQLCNKELRPFKFSIVFCMNLHVIGNI